MKNSTHQKKTTSSHSVYQGLKVIVSCLLCCTSALAVTAIAPAPSPIDQLTNIIVESISTPNTP